MKMPKPTLCINLFPWNSLRTHDQPLLFQQIPSDFLLNLALAKPGSGSSHTYRHSLPRFSELQLSFHIDCLLDLQQNLRKMNSDLVVIEHKSIPQFIQAIKEDYDIVCLASTRQYTSQELDIIALFSPFVPRVMLVDSLTVVKQSIFKNPVPSVYTTFRKQVEGSPNPYRKVVPSHTKKLAPFPVMKDSIETVKIERMDVKLDPRSVVPFRGGETSAHQRIEDYFKSGLVDNYKKTRNGMLGVDYSTKFSLFLAHGCVSPAYILSKLRDFEENVVSNHDTYWVLFELLWRDYFIFLSRDYGVLLFHPYGTAEKRLEWDINQEWFEKWCQGETGVPFIDVN